MRCLVGFKLAVLPPVELPPVFPSILHTVPCRVGFKLVFFKLLLSVALTLLPCVPVVVLPSVEIIVVEMRPACFCIRADLCC